MPTGVNKIPTSRNFFAISAPFINLANAGCHLHNIAASLIGEFSRYLNRSSFQVKPFMVLQSTKDVLQPRCLH
uniref:Uncharacterized protein n=1 Tax=Hyaloperonospora arabidopsidis (strain Emoy2) TaxID=559515 RepID=M4BN53_HYAAE